MITCSRCDQAAVYTKTQRLCAKHHRFTQMRVTAKQRGRTVPSHDELERMTTEGMKCPECTKQMHWLGRDGLTFVATLQHYRDGTLAIICKSCNSRHNHAPGDSFRDNPKDHKHCPSCKQFRPLSEYSADRKRSPNLQVQSRCKKCQVALNRTRIASNRDRYNQWQREYRHRKNAERREARLP